jgi:hypothetical protein
MNRKNAHFIECHPAQKTYHPAVEPVSETVYGDYTEFFVGFTEYLDVYPQYKCVAKGNSNSELETDFADSGLFGYTWDGGGSLTCNDIIQFSDGRLLIAHNYYTLTMLNVDGSVDATWGTDGHYIHPDSLEIYRILLDNDENIHIFCGVSVVHTQKVYIKISGVDGSYLGGLTDNNTYLRKIQDAQWANAEKTRIIAIGANNGYYLGNYKYPDMVAINPTTPEIDTSWTGNISIDGYAVDGAAGLQVRILSDGSIIILRANSVCLRKYLADGSVLDTDWGTNGYLDLELYSYVGDSRDIDIYEDMVFVNIRKLVEGNKRCVLHKIDTTGTVIDTKILTYSSDYTITLVKCLNDKLILGGDSSAYNDMIEIWSQDFVKESGFNLPGINIDLIRQVFPDETTRTVVTAETEGNAEYWTDVATSYSHLEGETVSILADGVEQTEQEVIDGVIDETGIVDTEMHVGLKYPSKLQPMRPVTSPEMMASTVTVKKMGISVHNTDDITVGILDSDMKDVSFADMKNKCEIDGLYTGTVEVSVPDGYSKNCPLQIETDAPLPCTIRAMIPKLERTGI